MTELLLEFEIEKDRQEVIVASGDVVKDLTFVTNDPAISLFIAEGGAGGSVSPTITQIISSSLQNGVNTVFALAEKAVLSSVQVFRNGLREFNGIGYTASATQITFTTAPLDSDLIAVVYQKSLT